MKLYKEICGNVCKIKVIFLKSGRYESKKFFIDYVGEITAKLYVFP